MKFKNESDRWLVITALQAMASRWKEDAVDICFSRHEGAFFIASAMGVPLAGDDRIERAVDALARAVIESRQ